MAGTKTVETRTDSTLTVRVTKKLTEFGSTNMIENRTGSKLKTVTYLETTFAHFSRKGIGDIFSKIF